MIEWMYWTQPTAIFFIIIAVLLLMMILLERVRPTVPRVGWMRILTTRGERLFIALLAMGWINILWNAMTQANQWIALGISLVVAAAVLTFG